MRVRSPGGLSVAVRAGEYAHRPPCRAPAPGGRSRTCCGTHGPPVAVPELPTHDNISVQLYLGNLSSWGIRQAAGIRAVYCATQSLEQVGCWPFWSLCEIDLAALSTERDCACASLARLGGGGCAEVAGSASMMILSHSFNTLAEMRPHVERCADASDHSLVGHPQQPPQQPWPWWPHVGLAAPL